MTRIRYGSSRRYGIGCITAGRRPLRRRARVPPRRRGAEPGCTVDEPTATRRHRRHRLAHPPRPADRIRRSSSSTRQDIAKTGLNSIDDVLQRLPSAGGGLNGKFNNSRQHRQSARRRRRRRWLGRDRPALSRIAAHAGAGRRPALRQRRVGVSGVPGSVDLNTIPDSMIERIEVLQDGASAIYGSDAIAGVVNIITKSARRA